MNIWISSNIKSKNHFAVHAAAGLLGIVFTAVILIAFGSIVTIHCSESKETILLLLCLTVTALVIFLGCAWDGICSAMLLFSLKIMTDSYSSRTYANLSITAGD